MTKIIDLRPDKKLVNTNFEKYQFCSDTILGKQEIELQTEILRIELSASQDSWLEARQFAFHNHLFKNPYDSTCWFIDKDGQIWKFKGSESLDLIYTSNSIISKSCNFKYNPSIAFASKNIFAICNGGGSLEFLIEYKKGIQNFVFNIEPAIILDARFIKESSEIIIAICMIDESEGKKFTKLIFLFYNYDENTNQTDSIIKLNYKRSMKVKGPVENVYIEENGKFCHIISQNQVEFEYDSTKLDKIKDDSSLNDSQIKIPQYCWSQDEDSITVYVKVPEKYNKLVAKVDVTSNSVLIAVADIILLSGETPNRLEAQLTTWRHKNDTLEVELSKSESGLMWSELMKGDTGGEYLSNEVLAAEIHSRFSHLCSNQQEVNAQDQPAIGFNSEQLEECDLSGSENILQRINFANHSITHMAILGSSNRILFIEKQSSGQIICLRHDHDGCIWMMKESNNEDWELEHIHTFPGFGYVEASKTNKKFCVSPPDGSFIAVVEHTKHAFLYEKPENNAQIGKQRILDFGSESSPILGAVTINKYLIILTKDVLYQLQIYS
ncbi:PREDICTED: nudC domain-containing protein 1 [Ceratosolen solmsi marchali]|uniref:NudC domain-containing protein 1 n=1 Tax=Ceratosolen solmsi marchali TaxID=326594 RepID=A0AAJ6YWA6_9HYME|nr:PREDICTED: nudC domain-containing protein 1 [Ceratosolen solmsi marchali]